MKFLSEYRDPVLVSKFLAEIHRITTKKWSLMEICGGQTHSLVKNGILNLLPHFVTMIHGPGCPVCVTPVRLIDQAIQLAEIKNLILCSFGDMLRVPGSKKSLLMAKASGADIRILYSPLEAVKLAQKNPTKEVVFFAVGFETTAPANALSVIHAAEAGLTNYSILTSHVLVPPAMEALLNDEDHVIDGFLAAGHVCTVMGLEQYYPLTKRYQVPIVATGFEPVDLLQGILMAIRQLERGEARVENQYSRVISHFGNRKAQAVIQQVFEVTDQEWRGIGVIPRSGYQLRVAYRQFDAASRFNVKKEPVKERQDCIAGQILRGLKKPPQCPFFGKQCTPTYPMGAPMVSSEGACAAYFQLADQPLEHSL